MELGNSESQLLVTSGSDKEMRTTGQLSALSGPPNCRWSRRVTNPRDTAGAPQ